ncbi:MAG: hypothetical protein MI674_00450 [Cytophagales bacterium]|nr:hypothetical protein [Cytophagales bacterium]
MIFIIRKLARLAKRRLLVASSPGSDRVKRIDLLHVMACFVTNFPNLYNNNAFINQKITLWQ